MQRVADARVAVLGLGYVGLPLAVEFGKRLPVVGFDISERRVSELRGGVDRTLEVSGDELAEATGLSFSSGPSPSSTPSPSCWPSPASATSASSPGSAR